MCRQAARVLQVVVLSVCRKVGEVMEAAVRVLIWPVVVCLAGMFEGVVVAGVARMRSILQRPCLVCTAMLMSAPLLVRVDHVEQHTTLVSIFGVPLAMHSSDRSMWSAVAGLVPRQAQLVLAIHATLSRSQVQTMQQAGSWLPLAQRAGHLLQLHSLLVVLAAAAVAAWWTACRVQFRISLVQVQARCRADLTVGESAALPFPRREVVPATSRIHTVHALMLMPPPVPHRRRLQVCLAEMLEGRE